MRSLVVLFLGLYVVAFTACKESAQHSATAPEIRESDPLPSWNEGETKNSIINFVTRVCDQNGSDYVPVNERIATFDNDGNLWSEKPFYFQLRFAIDRVKAMAEQHPEWADEQPFKAAMEEDLETLLSYGKKGLLQIVMATHSGMTETEFSQSVATWLERERHPRFDKPYNELIYQPMLELLDYLRTHDFKVFIVSGGGIDFIRVWAEEAYGIPKDQVVGSSLKSEFVLDESGKGVVRKIEGINFIDDHEGKPVGIHQHIGSIPIFASGNSDGDLRMLQYAASGTGARFMLYLHHTDEEREWAYDRDSHVGKLDKGLDEAEKNGWTVIDMAKDWKVVYPFEMNN